MHKKITISDVFKSELAPPNEINLMEIWLKSRVKKLEKLSDEKLKTLGERDKYSPDSKLAREILYRREHQ